VSDMLFRHSAVVTVNKDIDKPCRRAVNYGAQYDLSFRLL